MKSAVASLFVVLVFEVCTCLHLPKCERIVPPICQDLGYNMTMMPNFAGHSSQQDASIALQAFQPLMHYNCSKHLRLFVCSVFVPLCSEHVPGAVPACRDLCDSVRQDCQPVLDRFLLPWPPQLECSRFPAPPALCVHPPNINIEPTVDVNVEKSKLITDKVLLEDRMNFSYLDSNKVTFSHCPPRFAFVDETCTPLCGQDAYYRLTDKQYTKNWLVIWSAISFAITSFTLLTFWLNQNRFQYPERPLLFMTFNCWIYSLLILVRTLLGHNLIVCNLGYLVTKSSDNTICATSSFVIHLLELSIRMWWLIFCACWYLHASCEWSNESLSGMSSLFQIGVYGFSGIPALLALTTGHTSADELTSSCSIKEESSLWFIVFPHCFTLILGLISTLGVANALIKVKTSFKETNRCVKKLQRLMFRLAIFTILYLLPEISYLASTIYESWHRPWWKSLALLSALDCRSCSHEPVYHTASLQAVLLKIMSDLSVCVCCLMWVCSGKTWRTWRKVCESPKKSPATVIIGMSGQKVTMKGPITKV